MNLKFPHPLELLGEGMAPPPDVLAQALLWHESRDLIDGLMMVGLLIRLGYVPADKKKAIEEWMFKGLPHPMTRALDWVREHCTEEILDHVEMVLSGESITVMANLEDLDRMEDDARRVESTFWVCELRDDLECLCMVLWVAGRRYDDRPKPSPRDFLAGLDHTAEYYYRKYVDQVPWERWTERLREAALSENCHIWWGIRYEPLEDWELEYLA